MSLTGMILCAGLGTRLRPFTHRWPKPAMPLFDGPLVRHGFAALAKAGIRDVGVNTHHLGDVMATAAQAECTRLGLRLSVSHEAGEIQGTGGGIRGLRALLAQDVCVVLNGDVLFTLDVAQVVEAHRASGADATMVLLPMPEGEKYNPVEVDVFGHVRRIAGVGPGGERLVPWHFSGAHVLSPQVFDFMAPSGAEDINRDVYRRMMEAGLRIHAHVVTDRRVYWSDLGTPERYLKTVQDVLYGHVAAVRPVTSPGARLGDARISGPAWFGDGAVLEAGVRIGAAVAVGPGAKIGAGAMLNRTVVLDGAEVPAGALFEDALIGPGGAVWRAADSGQGS